MLLTVSGVIPSDLAENVAAGRRPRADYSVLQEALDADLIDIDAALAVTGWIGALLHRVLGGGGLLAWYCYRRRRDYRVIVTDGEQVGLPLALLGRVFGRGTAKHMMIVHILSTPAKARVIRVARLASVIDRFVVYCSWQRDFIERQLGVRPERVVLSTFMVDTVFFDPARVDVPQERLICAAGLERRDYATLMQAVDGLDVRVVIAAASPWSTQSDSTADRPLPANVEVQRLSLFELPRALRSVAVRRDAARGRRIPGRHHGHSRGNGDGAPRRLHATHGQTDTIIPGETGLYVPPSDPTEMRSAIQTLLDDEAKTQRMGSAARRWVLANADIDIYAERIATWSKIMCNE